MRALVVALVFAAGLTGHPGPSGVSARQRVTTTTSEPVQATTTSTTPTTTSTTPTTSSTTSIPAPTTTEPDPDPTDPDPAPGPGPGSTGPATTPTTLPTATTLVPPSTVAPPTVEIDKPSVEPGGVVVLTGDGCGPGAPVVVGVGDLTVSSIPGRADGSFVVVLTLPDLDPGRYDVHIDCPISLDVPLDVVVATSVATPNSVLALFIFFVLLGLVLFRRRRLVFRPPPQPQPQAVDSGDGPDP